jgi:D-glycero-alpha-D-manno-heptose-7-phosphate kinase
MIITRTPYRISLFGGGTDHPSWYQKNCGAVLSFTIDKYSYLNVRVLPPFFNHKYRISYSKVEELKNLSEIKHPAVRQAFVKYAQGKHLELHHHGDLPARSGVGSSSAFSVGVIQALLALNEKKVTAIELAKLAIEFEQVDLAENVGSQDQIACALGGINFISFGPQNYWDAEPVVLSDSYIQEIEKRIILIYSGIDRVSSNVTKYLLENIDLKVVEMKRTQQLAEECKNIFLTEGELSIIGPMLIESWELKRKSNPAAVNPNLENFFMRGLSAGASGGKILGAGGGGFFLFWVEPENETKFRESMSSHIIIPIRISKTGSTRIL